MAFPRPPDPQLNYQLYKNNQEAAEREANLKPSDYSDTGQRQRMRRIIANLIVLVLLVAALFFWLLHGILRFF